MAILHDRVRTLRDETGHSNASLAKAIGKPPSYIANFLREQTECGVLTAAALAQEFGVSLNYLVGMDDYFSVEASLKNALSQKMESALTEVAESIRRDIDTGLNAGAVVRWWLSVNGRIDRIENMGRQFDVYKVPEPGDVHVKPLRMGGDSLAASVLGQPDRDRLERSIKSFPDEANKKLLIHYDAAAQDGIAVSIEEMDVGVPELKDRVKLKYLRVLLKVHDPMGGEYILNFSELLA